MRPLRRIGTVSVGASPPPYERARPAGQPFLPMAVLSYRPGVELEVNFSPFFIYLSRLNPLPLRLACHSLRPSHPNPPRAGTGAADRAGSRWIWLWAPHLGEIVVDLATASSLACLLFAVAAAAATPSPIAR